MRVDRFAVRAAALAAVLGLAAAACGDSDDDAGSASTTGGSPDAEALAAEVVEHYADGVFAAYSASLEPATTMDDAIDAFVAEPNQETLAAARTAWIDARDDYGLTEAFRF
jgi:putative iron-regulated protein